MGKWVTPVWSATLTVSLQFPALSPIAQVDFIIANRNGENGGDVNDHHFAGEAEEREVAILDQLQKPTV